MQKLSQIILILKSTENNRNQVIKRRIEESVLRFSFNVYLAMIIFEMECSKLHAPVQAAY